MPLSVVVILEDTDSAEALGVDWSALGLIIAGEARGLQAARQLLTACRPDIVLMDVLPPARDSFALLAHMRAVWPDARVILRSRRTSLDVTRPAIRLGVSDFLPASVPAAALRAALTRAAREARQARELAEARLTERRRARLMTLLTNDESRGSGAAAVAQAGADRLVTDGTGAFSESGIAALNSNGTRSLLTGDADTLWGDEVKGLSGNGTTAKSAHESVALPRDETDAREVDEPASFSERGTNPLPKDGAVAPPKGATVVCPKNQTDRDLAASGNAELPLDAYCVLVAQPLEATADPAAVMARVDAGLRQTGIRAVSATLYDAVVLVLTQAPADGDWQAAAAAAADVAAEHAGTPVRIGIGRPAQTSGMLRAAYQQARSALWDITLRGEARSRGFYQGVQRQGGGRLTEVHRELDALIEKADLTDRSADDAAEVIDALGGRQYSHLRAIVSLYAMALCRKFACPADGQVGSAMHEAWFVGNGEDVRACLRRICAALRADREARESELSPVCRSALWYVRIHAVEGPALGDVAGLLHVSPKYLSALIRRETGVTFHEHVREARMERARALLADPCVSVAEVARAAGYANYITFFNVFKRVEQMTPTEYRRREGRFAALPENAG